MPLSSEEKIRYARQIAVPGIGKEGQERIRNSKVLVIGCGALGSMVAMQLAGAGIGTLGLVDFDRIDISNLQRQFFFNTFESGNLKIEILAKRLKDFNPDVNLILYSGMMTHQKGESVFPDYDFIVDATDNPESKRMTGLLSKKYGKACCIAGVRDFNGQVMTFLPEDPRFEDYFGVSTSEGLLPCSLGGVMGPTASLCASIQSSETLKYIAKIGELLSGRILVFSLLTNSFRIFNL